MLESITRAHNNLQDAIDYWNTELPNLADTNKIVTLNCLNDVSYTRRTDPNGVKIMSSIDNSSMEKNISIPSGWIMSEDGRLVIVASNGPGSATRRGGHAGDPSKGFSIGTDGSQACVTINSDYVTIKGLKLIGSKIKDPAISYIGITIDPSVSKVILDSNMIMSCQKGITQ